MKTFVSVFGMLVVFACSEATVIPRGQPTDPTIDHGVPIRLEDIDTAGGIESATNAPLVRHRRLTWDVFSFESGVVTPNNAPCALKCIGTGKKGGHCEGVNCVCREDKRLLPW